MLEHADDVWSAVGEMFRRGLRFLQALDNTKRLICLLLNTSLRRFPGEDINVVAEGGDERSLELIAE